MADLKQPLIVSISGEDWMLFDVNFISDGEKFSFYIYARNREEAILKVQDIKETAVLNPDDLVDIVQ